jgi:hypothetical protein
MIKIGEHRISTKIKRYYAEDTTITDPNNTLKRIPDKYYIIFEFLNGLKEDNERIEFKDKESRDTMLHSLDRVLVTVDNGELTKPNLVETLQEIQYTLETIKNMLPLN